jgi:predicted amidohydrolase YtcJ
MAASTLDARNTIANTVTIRHGRFATVGSSSQRGAAPPNAQVIDLRGRTVVPGLIETHLHGMDTADRPGYHVLDVESASSIREALEVLASHRKTVPDGQWLTAIGAVHPNLWAEHRFPTLKELDEAVPDRPVLLFQGFTGAGATNTLGKHAFDVADAAPPCILTTRRSMYRRRFNRPVESNDRRSIDERIVSAAEAAEVRRQEAKCAPHNGIF